MYHLPSYYDILHTPGTAEDVTLYERIARRFGIDPQNWLEPGCGTGRHLRVLSGRGFRAAGFDIDREMVDYARRSLARRARSGFVFVAEMNDFAPKLARRRFDVAISPHSTIRHLLSERDAVSHLRQIASVLRGGGIYIVGISFARYGSDTFERDVWLANRGGCHIRQTIGYTPPDAAERIERVKSRLVITRPSGRDAHEDQYRLRSYSGEQWAGLIRKAGMVRVASLDEWGDPLKNKTPPYQLEILASRK